MSTRTQTSPPDARAEALVAAYERAGYRRVAPPILQPAEPFLDLSGEDIRKRMYLTTDADGRELCLRPDLTIPVSCDYLASPAAGSPQGFCYLGPVFRDRGGAAGGIPAGRHRILRPAPTRPRPTPRCWRSASTPPRITASPTPEIRIGDVGLFAALIAALDLAPAWKRRLIKDFNRKTSLAHDLDRLTLSAASQRPEYQGVLAALAGSDPQGGARAGHRSAVDRRHHHGRRPLGRRDRRPLPRTGGARRRAPRCRARRAR